MKGYKGWVVCENGVCVKKDSKVSWAVYCCDDWKDCCGKVDSDLVACSVRVCGALGGGSCSKDHKTSGGTCGECCSSDEDCDAWVNLCKGYAAYCVEGGCECLGKCENNKQCAPGYCCKYLVDETSTECVESGSTAEDKEGRSYLCDPPVGFESSRSDKKLDFLDLIFFFNPFSLFS